MSEVDLQAALRAHFNFPAFRPGQAEAIQHVLDGQYTLVIWSLIALMKDQVDSLARRVLYGWVYFWRYRRSAARCRDRYWRRAGGVGLGHPTHLLPGVLERILNVNNGIAFHWIW
jgi:hypothetical protein